VKERLSGSAVELTDPRPSSQELSTYDSYNRLSSPTDDEDDDLFRYTAERVVKHGIDALKWWRDNERVYPILHELAVTYLAAPLSSAAYERLFSIASNVVNQERPHTQA